MIKIPKFVQGLKPYQPGKPIEELAREKNLSRIVKLASAENPLGPSPKAMAAIQENLTGLNRYPDPSSYDLVKAVAKKYKVQAQHVICTHGADAVISYILNAFTHESDEIITAEGTFMGIYVAARKTGRKLVKVPLDQYSFDLNAILGAINERTTMIYLANPNNPTGTMFDRNKFETFMTKVPKDIMVILDEAYTTYANHITDYPNGLQYEYENMVVTRTLSKAYGLAGLRVGFAVGSPQVIEALYKVKLPFEPNLLAQVGAIAALEDDEFLEKSIATNSQSLSLLYDCFVKQGIAHVKSYTNFILALMPSEEFAQQFTEECMNRGLIIRHVKAFGIPNGIRINSGTLLDTTFACQVISEVNQLLNNQLKDDRIEAGIL